MVTSYRGFNGRIYSYSTVDLAYQLSRFWAKTFGLRLLLVKWKSFQIPSIGLVRVKYLGWRLRVKNLVNELQICSVLIYEFISQLSTKWMSLQIGPMSISFYFWEFTKFFFYKIGLVRKERSNTC